MTLKQLIAKKKWYHVNPDLTDEHFPRPKNIETEGARLITMNKSFTSEEALEKIKSEGCRPANAWELATWANKHRDEIPKGKWVVAFGQFWQDSGGCHGVPDVSANSDGGFEFGLGCFGDDWVGVRGLLVSRDKSLGHSDTQDSLSLRLKNV